MQLRIKSTLLVMSAILGLSSAANAVEIVVSGGGDLSFSDSHLKAGVPDVSSDRVFDQGEYYSWASLTKYIEPLFKNTDINFLNLESVVGFSKRGLKTPKSSGFTFYSHPEGIAHMIENLNINLFSLANNHANDFGAGGLSNTVQSMKDLKNRYPHMQYAGVYANGASIKPIEFNYQGRRVAFAAVKSPNGAGSGNYKLIPMGSSDYNTLIRAFGESQAEIKILSIHEGVEGKVTFDGNQAARYRDAVDKGGLNIIFAHHPHVVRPVEMYNGAAIFYSLGNFLILGAANLDGRPDHYRNYGLVGRVYLELGHSGAKVTAIEAVPLKGMHKRPYVPEAKVATVNMNYLNKLNQTESPKYGVKFNVTSRGTGVACLANGSGVRFKKICQ